MIFLLSIRTETLLVLMTQCFMTVELSAASRWPHDRNDLGTGGHWGQQRAGMDRFCSGF